MATGQYMTEEEEEAMLLQIVDEAEHQRGVGGRASSGGGTIVVHEPRTHGVEGYLIGRGQVQAQAQAQAQAHAQGQRTAIGMEVGMGQSPGFRHGFAGVGGGREHVPRAMLGAEEVRVMVTPSSGMKHGFGGPLGPVGVSGDHSVCGPASALDTVTRFKEFQRAAFECLDPTDYQSQPGQYGRRYITKSGYLKLATVFEISLESLHTHNERNKETGAILFSECTVRAKLPSGRFADAHGACSANERRFSNPAHHIPATAETRAQVRGISMLLGIGEANQEWM